MIENSSIKKIIEEKDTTEEEKNKISKYRNIFLMKQILPKEFVPKINQNKQKEYYLTSLFEVSKIPIYPSFISEKDEKYILV